MARSLGESRLHRQALTGALAAAFAQGELRIGNLALRGRGFSLGAQGSLREGIAFQAQAPLLASLVPGAGGRLEAEGRVSRRNGQWDLRLHSQGQDLTYGEARAGSLSLDTRLSTGPEASLEVRLGLRSLSWKALSLPSASLAAQGTAGRHRIEGRMKGGQAQARFALEGGLAGQVWQGRIVEGSGRVPLGPWSLASATELSWSAKGFHPFPPATLRSGGESLSLAARFQSVPGAAGPRPPGRVWPGSASSPGFPRACTGGCLVRPGPGELLPQERFRLDGRVALAGGKVRWSGPESLLEARLGPGDLSWQWQGPWAQPLPWRAHQGVRGASPWTAAWPPAAP